MLDLFYTLSQLIEDGDAALEEGVAVEGRLHTLWGAIKQADAECVFQIGNRLRHDGTRDCEAFGRLRHVALLNHGHEDMQVARLEAPTDAIRPFHAASYPKR